MAIASLRVPMSPVPQVDNTSWLSDIAKSLGSGIDEFSQRRSFGKLADLIQQPGQAPAQQPTGGFLSSLMPQTGSQAAQPTGAAPVAPVRRGQAQGSTYQPFINTVRAGGLTNPNALAAVAAYGDAESGWNPKNAVSTWSDPSQSGQPGTSGGILSWRGDRYSRLAAGGDLSPEAQARYFLQEDPQLIAALNQAKSPEEAASLMANAWKFAGYDKPGGEGARRAALARNYFANEYANQPASSGAAAAIEAQAPGGMGSPLTEQAFDDRFGPAPLPAEQVVGEEALAARLAESNAAGPAAQPAMAPPQVAEQPAAYAPNQVADASGAFAGVPGVQPIAPGSVNPEVIQFMLRDPNLREMGLKLWAQNATGKTGDDWQFIQSANGDLLRANQQTGAIERVGNFGKNQDQFRILTADERTQYGIPQDDRRVYQVAPSGQISAVGGAGQTINVGNEVEARRQAAAQAGLTEDDPAYQGFILTGKLPRENEQNLTATDKKAILEADEMVLNAQNVLPLLDRALELNDLAYDGMAASERGAVSGNLGSEAGQATMELENNVLAGALGQLKAIFGGAPTEGERKILVDVEGAINRPANVRQQIFARAKAAAERRMKFYRERADELRGGDFYKSNGGTSGKGNRTTSGVTWEIVE